MGLELRRAGREGLRNAAGEDLGVAGDDDEGLGELECSGEEGEHWPVASGQGVCG